MRINRNRNNLSSVQRRFSPFCSLSQSCNSQSVDQVPAPQRTLHDSFLQVVLVSPQIPGNVGSIARTCAASTVGLHLVEPLGFTVDNTKLKRAGLDYWPYVVVKVHRSWLEFMDYFMRQEGENDCWLSLREGPQYIRKPHISVEIGCYLDQKPKDCLLRRYLIVKTKFMVVDL